MWTLLTWLYVLFVSQAARSPAPELILYNSHVITLNARSEIAEAVAISGGKFVAVGKTAQIRAMAGAATRQIDLGGKTVIPGLADNHFHSIGGGPGVDLSRTRTINDVLDAIRARAAKTPAGEVIVTNSDWHEGQLKEQRLPYRNDLDRAAPDHPLVVVRGGHEYILNSVALRKWNITESTRVPEGGSIGRDADGKLNGELVDRAKNLVTLPPGPRVDAEQRIRDQAAEFQKLHEAGLTSIRYPGVGLDMWNTLQEMKRRGLLTMRVNVLFRVGGNNVADALARLGVKPDEGDDWIRAGGIKLVVDGGFEGGWMRDPYEEPWGRHGEYRGLQTFPSEEYKQTVSAINRAGWRVATHAVGDAAIDLVLDAYEAADRQSSIANKRWTIEHGFIPRTEHFPRMKKLGLVLSAQDHLYLAAPSLKNYWGEKRTAWMTPLRAYIDAGIPISSGTDSAVVPYPPLWTLYHFITRDTISAGVVGPEQRITREEALRAATIGNAYLTFEEKTKGSIETGKLADLVVLDQDILSVPPKNIESMKIAMTVVGGKIVYGEPQQANTPFKLATFETGGRTRLGMVLGNRMLDIAGANAALTQTQRLATVTIPNEMRELIEAYDRVKPRLYQIANYYKSANTNGAAFAFEVDKVSIKAPIKYPANLLAIAANYKLHAGEMFPAGSPQQKAALEADQDKEDPVFFAKSPRSCIIDPGETYFMPPNRNIDWEGELAIIIGKQALNVSEANAHDYVFGYSIMYDLSDRGGQGRPLTGMFASPNWFAGKSRDRSAPFGPFILPKEFAPPHFRIVTKVNGVVKQDGNTENLIWDEAHMVRYLTSILTLYPGDVISSGTPDGVGAGRKPPEFLKPGDTVTIEIEGIGTLTTHMAAAR